MREFESMSNVKESNQTGRKKIKAMGLVVPLLRHWHPPSLLARSLILSFDVSLMPSPGDREKGRSHAACWRERSRGTERETVERPKGTKADRKRPSERSRGVGEWPRVRERSTTPGPKESEATLHNAAARQGKVQRGRSEPSVAGMDRDGSESWARNGRAKGARGAKGEGQEREGSKGTAGEQPDRPTDRLPVSHPCSVVGVRSRRTIRSVWLSATTPDSLARSGYHDDDDDDDDDETGRDATRQRDQTPLSGANSQTAGSTKFSAVLALGCSSHAAPCTSSHLPRLPRSFWSGKASTEEKDRERKTQLAAISSECGRSRSAPDLRGERNERKASLRRTRPEPWRQQLVGCLLRYAQGSDATLRGDVIDLSVSYAA